MCVAAGANLKLTDEGISNLISNCSFQDDGDNIANLTPMQISGWSWTITCPRGLVNSGGNGLQGNGGNVSLAEPWTTYGNVTVFMRENTSLAQTIEVPEDGEYLFSFVEAHRKSYDDARQIPYTIKIGDVLVFKGNPTSSAKFTRHSVSVALTRGSYELEIHFGDDSLEEPAGRQGAIVYFDDFRLSPAAETRQPRRAKMEFARGSGLILDNAFPCVLDNVWVDGTEVRARPMRIAAAGVSVQGEGVVKPLRPTGLRILVR
ncbi:MAG: hypothetical protein ACI4RD_00485 [Kiritimatiellia bacterium]